MVSILDESSENAPWVDCLANVRSLVTSAESSHHLLRCVEVPLPPEVPVVVVRQVLIRRMTLRHVGVARDANDQQRRQAVGDQPHGEVVALAFAF